tara:strand:- start:394 stop:630 length:237 start_codon:yes stop_codon:yes gene_type:complete
LIINIGKKVMIDNIENVKKGTELRVDNGLGLCTAYSLESIKQGKGFKKTLLVDLRASEVGFFDEMGSIYVEDIKEVIL